MEKLKMHSPNFVDENIAKLAALFPNCVTESADANGKLKKAIDFDLASSTMKCNTWESRKENAILSGYGKLQASIIVRTRLNNGHALGKEVVG